MPSDRPFKNRHHAGQVLAGRLEHLRYRDGLLVLALPRGGVAVAYEVAEALQAPLDICIVRKLGHPHHPEYAIGAIASGGVRVMQPLPGAAVSEDAIQAVVVREQAELERREMHYRGQRPAVPLAGRAVVIVDDGLATGATMRAAVKSVRQHRPACLVVAVPVGAADTCRALAPLVDDLVCAATPEPFHAVGLWYDTFPQATDDEVQTLLQQAHDHDAQWRRAGSRP